MERIRSIAGTDAAYKTGHYKVVIVEPGRSSP
jgi:hypothetical protein